MVFCFFFTVLAIFAPFGMLHGPPPNPSIKFMVAQVYLHILAVFVWFKQMPCWFFYHMFFISFISEQILPQPKGVEGRENSQSVMHGIEWFWPNFHFKIYLRKSHVNVREENWLGACFIPSITYLGVSTSRWLRLYHWWGRYGVRKKWLLSFCNTGNYGCWAMSTK